MWRTLVDERAMPSAVALPAAGEPAREVYAGLYRLVKGNRFAKAGLEMACWDLLAR